MDGRGGCCIARYATGGGGYDAATVDRIMLRFRPIAPKPSSCGSSSGGSSPDSKDACVRKTGRGRRRRSATSSSSDTKKRSSGRKRRPKASGDEIGRGSVSLEDQPAVVTLSLLPESPELEISAQRNDNTARRNGYNHDAGVAGFPGTNAGLSLPSTWLSFEDNATALVPQQQQTVRRPVETWVSVESVADTWLNGFGLARRDDEARTALASDTCPSFVSDALGRVTWTNGAFREMVAGREEREVVVWLAVKETAAASAASFMHAAFTCTVRVQYVRGKEKRSLTLPCDAWRMDGGGFAWRLDVKAALSLGR